MLTVQSDERLMDSVTYWTREFVCFLCNCPISDSVQYAFINLHASSCASHKATHNNICDPATVSDGQCHRHSV
jgi:hypothetical protein